MTKTTAVMMLYFSKIDNETYIGVDGNIIDLNEFGITEEVFRKISDEFRLVVERILNKNKDNRVYEESKL